MVKIYLFSIADGTVKLSGGDQNLRTPFLIRDTPDAGEEQGNLPAESDGPPSHFKTHRRMMMKQEMISVHFRELHVFVITLSRESNCTF